MNYFIKQGNQVSGPMTGKDVAQRVKSGDLSLDTLISNSSRGPWKSIADASQKKTKTKACPFCAEPIALAAIKCKHCGEMLNQDETTSPENEKHKKPKVSYSDDSLSINSGTARLKMIAFPIGYGNRDAYRFFSSSTEFQISGIKSAAFFSPCKAYPGKDSAWTILWVGMGLVAIPTVLWFLAMLFEYLEHHDQMHLADYNGSLGNSMTSVLASALGGLVLIAYSSLKLGVKAWKGGLLSLDVDGGHFCIPFRKKYDAESACFAIRHAIDEVGGQVTFTSMPMERKTI